MSGFKVVRAQYDSGTGRAYVELRTSLRQRHVSWKEVKGQIVEYLRSKGADRDQLAKEIKRVRKKIKPWLG
jgi:hypothetical protein